MTSVLVVAAYPDAEVLGCGGTIARHADAGHQVQVLIAAEGASSRLQKHDQLQNNKELYAVAHSAQRARSILGAAGVELLDLPDNRFDSLDRLDVIKRIEQRIDQRQTQVVYLHHARDVNVVHRRLHKAVVTACRPTPVHPVKRLLSFEVASSTEWQPPGSASAFQPNWFVNICAQWQYKRKALETYASEMRPWPLSRSLKSVGNFSRWCGLHLGVERQDPCCLLRCLTCRPS